MLLTVAYFCVGTELRFLINEENSSNFKKDSEMWHAKALHTSSTFLPSDCPLVSHVMGSYIKHHLKPKLEEKKLMTEKLQEKIEKSLNKAKEEELVVADERKKEDFK